MSYLEKQCAPDFVEQMKQDETGALLSSLVEDDAFFRKMAAFLEGEMEDTLADVLSLVLKCKRDAWEGLIVWIGPVGLKAILAELRLDALCMTLEEFQEQVPGEEVFAIVHHSMHFVPCWAPSFAGPFQLPALDLQAFSGRICSSI